MQTVIVIPCLNEESLIAATAGSLGFGRGQSHTPHETSLILVDNGSQDGTLTILEHIREQSRTGSVVVVAEAEQGYVPARHRGILAARDFAQAGHLSHDDVLILQADADTRYEPEYVEAMHATALAAPPNALIEGTIRPPSCFVRDHPGYQRLADEVDASVAPFFVDDGLDVIVDDKVSGFSLATYFAWGAHRREYTSLGAEIHAETARLFIRGKIRGAVRVRAGDAGALPSRRRILENPIRHFASAGFPRESSWWPLWRATYNGRLDLAAFEDTGSQAALAPAVLTRKAHLVALFGILPAVLERCLRGSTSLEPLHPFLREILDAFPSADLVDLDQSLAALFERVFRLTDDSAEAFAGL
jgi:glycosyltransferase involved in cell wall biosynthesis